MFKDFDCDIIDLVVLFYIYFIAVPFFQLISIIFYYAVGSLLAIFCDRSFGTRN